ncbi:CLUMA_CG018523, isoform A [Clunio marinus]|uniref:CLUMA_CG018523, isoform A n=1 Tax=Clunio marinus TaxID=568069 RepID=A0A1J1IZ56_9DIPT|nr:CLUMA_CG018523, isoform A [Clunio marinus]
MFFVRPCHVINKNFQGCKSVLRYASLHYKISISSSKVVSLTKVTTRNEIRMRVKVETQGFESLKSSIKHVLNSITNCCIRNHFYQAMNTNFREEKHQKKEISLKFKLTSCVEYLTFDKFALKLKHFRPFQHKICKVKVSEISEKNCWCRRMFHSWNMRTLNISFLND